MLATKLAGTLMREATHSARLAGSHVPPEQITISSKHMAKASSDTFVTFRAFYDQCLLDARLSTRQQESYLNEHTLRLHTTYNTCVKLLEATPARVLSVGAGSAYVEAQLALRRGAKITVIDFADAIAAHRDLYDKYRFTPHASDLAADQFHIDGQFDLVLCCEVIEHLPFPPSRHFKMLSTVLAPGGRLLVTTPNLARLSSAVRLILGRPILPDPGLTFSPVSYANESVHRREYVPSEMVDAFVQNRLRVLSTQYTWNGAAASLGQRLRRAFDIISPRLSRPTMIMVGELPA